MASALDPWINQFVQPRAAATLATSATRRDKSCGPKVVSVAKVANVAREPTPWNADDWQAYFDERAGIAEYDGGLSRAAAEQQAHDECVTRWLQLNPPVHDNSELCIHCHHPRRKQSFVGVINRADNLVWVHNECLQPWFAHRRQQAVAALGIQISLNSRYNITKVVRK